MFNGADALLLTLIVHGILYYHYVPLQWQITCFHQVVNGFVVSLPSFALRFFLLLPTLQQCLVLQQLVIFQYFALS